MGPALNLTGVIKAHKVFSACEMANANFKLRNAGVHLHNYCLLRAGCEFYIYYS